MTTVKRLFDIPEFQLKNFNLPIAFATKYGENWQAISTQEYINKIKGLSMYLLSIGVKKNDKIAIITNRNRTEWHIADIAIMQVGAQSVPIYDSTSLIDLNYIFNHAEVKYCFVANKELHTKVSAIETTYLKKIFSFDKVQNCLSIEEAINEGKNKNNTALLAHTKTIIRPNDLATIIYTSGTTDRPKGVMLSHQNILSNVTACLNMFPEIEGQGKALSFLPICHIFERMVLYLNQYKGLSIYFAESINTIAVDMAVIKPHILTVVPRLLEKIHDKIIEKGANLGIVKRKIFNWAIELGYEYEPYEQNGTSYEKKLARARKLIFSKWQDVFGSNVKIILCGSSKLQPQLSRIFNAAGIPVMDGYGLTETSPVISVNTLHENGMRIGSIGKPLENVDVKIAKDGEILSKGPNSMMGYYKDDIKTEDSFVNGYLKTGDLGRIDADGFLYITGRKKEIFKTSGGKYVNPARIEAELRKSPFIEQVVVIGEGEKMPAAIIQPNFELLKKTYALDLKNKDLIVNEKVLSEIQNAINVVNENLGQWEKIKLFELTDDEWSVLNGHLTPTLKVKKDIIKSKYYFLYNKIYRPAQKTIN